MRKILYTLPLLALTMQPAMADNLDFVNNLGQSQFRDFSEDLGAALSYKAVAPAEPLGITGFDIGVEATSTKLEHPEAFDIACGGCGDENLIIPKLHVHKGLPASFDVGLMLASVPDSNVKLTGAELRYAFMEGGVATPAVAVRATYSKLDGVDQLDMDTRGLELTISKGFAMATPYAGIGQNWVSSRPDSSTGLKDEDFTQDKLYAGVNLNFGLMNLAFETDRTGGAASYSAKFGFRF